MAFAWHHQLRICLSDAMAAAARSEGGSPALRPLTDILAAHDAALVSQLDSLEAYVAEAEHEGPENSRYQAAGEARGRLN